MWIKHLDFSHSTLIDVISLLYAEVELILLFSSHNFSPFYIVFGTHFELHQENGIPRAAVIFIRPLGCGFLYFALSIIAFHI